MKVISEIEMGRPKVFSGLKLSSKFQKFLKNCKKIVKYLLQVGFFVYICSKQFKNEQNNRISHKIPPERR
jgi:hypothetical protein